MRAGSSALCKLRRPCAQVDVLAAILDERSAAKLEQFFAAFGAPEVAAMCFLLATSAPASVPSVRPPLLTHTHTPLGCHCLTLELHSLGMMAVRQHPW